MHPLFVTIDARLFQMLKKFEEAPCIHVLQDHNRSLIISSPRFRLNFVLNGQNELLSSEYEGYVLDQHQEFEDVFTSFSRYLALRLRDPKTTIAKPKLRILVLIGTITKDPAGSVDVDLPSDPSAKLGVSLLDAHHRLHTLSTGSITSRLQLRVLLASAGSSIPSAHSQMTGSEAALQVLQGCFFSASFSDAEKDLLVSLCSVAHREPGLKILASSILHKSERCRFLVNERGGESVDIDCTDELDEYSARCAQVPERNPLRTRLKEVEEKLLLGDMLQQDMLIKSSPTVLLDFEQPSVRATCVSEAEALFSRFLGSPDCDVTATIAAYATRK